MKPTKWTNNSTLSMAPGILKGFIFNKRFFPEYRNFNIDFFFSLLDSEVKNRQIIKIVIWFENKETKKNDPVPKMAAMSNFSYKNTFYEAIFDLQPKTNKIYTKIGYSGYDSEEKKLLLTLYNFFLTIQNNKSNRILWIKQWKLYFIRGFQKKGKRYNHSWKKLWDVGREIRVVLKIYFNWKHSPFQFFEYGVLMQTDNILCFVQSVS